MYTGGGDSLKGMESVPEIRDEPVADESALATVGPGIPRGGVTALAGVRGRAPGNAISAYVRGFITGTSHEHVAAKTQRDHIRTIADGNIASRAPHECRSCLSGRRNYGAQAGEGKNSADNLDEEVASSTAMATSAAACRSRGSLV